MQKYVFSLVFLTSCQLLTDGIVSKDAQIQKDIVGLEVCGIQSIDDVFKYSIENIEKSIPEKGPKE
jgi:uncharacterized protein YunC (DUF1805 family)